MSTPFTPEIVDVYEATNQGRSSCFFDAPDDLPEDYVFDRYHLAIRTMPLGTIEDTGYVAVRIHGRWQPYKVYLGFSTSSNCFRVTIGYSIGLKIAFPVDPRMTEQDIDGATVLYKNGPNTPNTCLLYTSPSPRDS